MAARDNAGGTWTSRGAGWLRYSAAAAPPSASRPGRSILEGQGPPALIFVIAITFNAVLSIVNGHVMQSSGASVAAVQMLVVALAAAASVSQSALFAQYCALALAFVAIQMLVSVGRGYLDPKALGEVLIMPVFLALGARMKFAVLVRAIFVVHLLVTGIGTFEVLFPQAFGAIFKISSYYINTRGLTPEDFYAGGDLFVNAERGGGRLLLPFTGFHRGSSLFLEPVTLGNWCIVICVFLIACWQRLTPAARALFALSTLWLIVVCDGRLAVGTCLMLVLVLPWLRYVPSTVSALYAPAFIALLFLLRSADFLPQTGDTLSGRYRGGIDLLAASNLRDLLGLSPDPAAAVDAGWVYMMRTQSLFGVLLFWFYLTLIPAGRHPSLRLLKHGLALFLAVCLTISYSILTIKLATLMWALLGCLQAEEQRSRAAGASSSR